MFKIVFGLVRVNNNENENENENDNNNNNNNWLWTVLRKLLRTVPTIVTAQIFCACEGSRARRERNAQHAGHEDWFCLL